MSFFRLHIASLNSLHLKAKADSILTTDSIGIQASLLKATKHLRTVLTAHQAVVIKLSSNLHRNAFSALMYLRHGKIKARTNIRLPSITQ